MDIDVYDAPYGRITDELYYLVRFKALYIEHGKCIIDMTSVTSRQPDN
jgi:hypothetical protein